MLGTGMGIGTGASGKAPLTGLGMLGVLGGAGGVAEGVPGADGDASFPAAAMEGVADDDADVALTEEKGSPLASAAAATGVDEDEGTTLLLTETEEDPSEAAAPTTGVAEEGGVAEVVLLANVDQAASSAAAAAEGSAEDEGTEALAELVDVALGSPAMFWTLGRLALPSSLLTISPIIFKAAPMVSIVSTVMGSSASPADCTDWA